ncbi:Gfo/Idh/MocA family protein [Algisphaera agarilytica]|uniref:Putative dehydrogenase n=1 Tax=Algisphaera agarilytica TaxID=1385975 RepID=A0A7X0H9R0_9BACT|nr:Gfo/Idh/MocA family oxidoreductase [Algisphaera agarilytica]MBB6431707.1 putative dehydrogenase [Algisphaera agarilytica]
MSSRIRTAIIGYGRSGQLLHAGGLRGNPESFDIKAIASRSAESRQKGEADFGCPTFADYREMLRQVELDLVVIVTRNDQHAEMACEALDAGCHVLVTKPLATNTQEVKEIYDAAQAAGKKVFPYLPARWGTDYRRLRDIVDSGEIGDVFAIHRSAFGFATRSDWQTQTEHGGGIVLNWGAHLIDPPMFLAGGAPKHVFGSCQQVLNPGDAEDVFYSILTMDNGVRVHSQWSFSPQNQPDWFVQGSGGCIIVNDDELVVYASTPEQPDDPTNFNDMKGEASQGRGEKLGEHLFGDPIEIYRDVADDLRGVRPYPVSDAESIRLIAILDGIKQSHQQQAVVPIP